MDFGVMDTCAPACVSARSQLLAFFLELEIHNNFGRMERFESGSCFHSGCIKTSNSSNKWESLGFESLVHLMRVIKVQFHIWMRNALCYCTCCFVLLQLGSSSFQEDVHACCSERFPLPVSILQRSSEITHSEITHSEDNRKSSEDFRISPKYCQRFL